MTRYLAIALVLLAASPAGAAEKKLGRTFTVSPGGRGISVSTSGGSIQLTLPRATTASIEATTSGGEIKSDLPVASTEWKEGHVKGPVNDGGPPIDLSTFGGGITVRAAT